MDWPEARLAGTYKDMVREMSNTNFATVEDEARYWLEHFDADDVEAAMHDAGYGPQFARQVMADVFA